ncbi:MAG: TIGR04282 family arsenosugar biosynthesis glycosyltransferase [Nitrolancea sp.]
MTDRLYIAARAPRPGFTKTRLGRVIGHESAASIYAAFLTDLAARFASAPFDTGWYITPPDAWPEINTVLPHPRRSASVIPQPDGDWTCRQRALFSGMQRRAESRTVLIASDSPHLPIDHVTDAFELLRSRDLVFGPVEDGGYYLIGMSSPRATAVLDDVRMSTGDVLERLIERAKSLRLSVGLVSPTFDIDQADDLHKLIHEIAGRSDLAATSKALERIGIATVPTVARYAQLTGIEADR